jgi:hypothetical protein
LKLPGEVPVHSPPFDLIQGGEHVEPRSERLAPWP